MDESIEEGVSGGPFCRNTGQVVRDIVLVYGKESDKGSGSFDGGGSGGVRGKTDNLIQFRVYLTMVEM